MIPHLLHVFPSFGIGGMPLRTVRLMAYLGKRCRHTIISLDGITTAAERITSEVSAEILPLMVDKRHPFANLLAFRRFLACSKPDLLATYNWGAIEWAAVNCCRPVCRHVHFEAGFGQEEATIQLRRRVLTRRLVLARSDYVVVPSRTLERIALSRWRLPPERVRYVPDGIDISRFARKSEASYGTTQHRDIVIGTVAPLRPEKNIARLIDVFCRVADDPRLRLVIAGDGPERVGLESLAAASGLNHRIVFLGNVARPEELLPNFDVFGLSSDTEQIPNSVLEAMAVGLPIAAVDVGDIRMMVASTNAPYIVPREDPDSFAAAIRQLVADPSLRSRIGMGNRLQVETRFRQELMFEQYEKLLLGGAPAAQSTQSREGALVDGHSQRADR